MKKKGSNSKDFRLVSSFFFFVEESKEVTAKRMYVEHEESDLGNEGMQGTGNLFQFTINLIDVERFMLMNFSLWEFFFVKEVSNVKG